MLFLARTGAISISDRSGMSIRRRLRKGLSSAKEAAAQEFIYASGLILSAEQLDHFYWGQRYFTLLFVRPIPKLIWPTKYEDLGLGWMVNEPGTAGLSDLGLAESRWFPALSGLRGGFIADVFR